MAPAELLSGVGSVQTKAEAEAPLGSTGEGTLIRPLMGHGKQPQLRATGPWREVPESCWVGCHGNHDSLYGYSWTGHDPGVCVCGEALGEQVFCYVGHQSLVTMATAMGSKPSRGGTWTA